MARFKVGDRVVAAADCHPFFAMGDAGVVEDEDEDTYYVNFDASPTVCVKCDGSREWWVVNVTAEQAPTARANDPATSKGKRKVNKYESAVLTTLSIKSLGRTGKEIAEYTGHPLNCITPRFAPLRRKGLIKDSGIKRDKQIVWMLA